MGVPTIAQARQAAEAVLAATPDAEVWLYGSLARGEARAGSDVDLYVVYADIDYTQRQEIVRRLTGAVRGALDGHRFDLHVSDLPEWEGRSGVSNTFEHEISRDVVRLAGRVARDDAQWAKPQVLPMTVRDEARRYLEDTLRKELRQALRNTAPDADEEPRLGTPVLASDADAVNEELQLQQDAEADRLTRMLGLTASCAMVVELSIKAAGTLQGLHPQALKKANHDVDRAVAQLEAPLRDELRDLLVRYGLTSADISKWREEATYPDDLDASSGEADRCVYAYLDTALAVADRVIAEHEAQGAASGRARRTLQKLADARARGRVRFVDEVDEDASVGVRRTSA